MANHGMCCGNASQAVTVVVQADSSGVTWLESRHRASLAGWQLPLAQPRSCCREVIACQTTKTKLLLREFQKNRIIFGNEDWWFRDWE
jgi:hypothetical protein